MWTNILALVAVAIGAVNSMSIPATKYGVDATLSPRGRTDAEARYQAECEGVIFPAIYPPTEADMNCRRLQYEAQCRDVSFISTIPPSDAEMNCRTLEYQTQCDGKQFAAIFPPSDEQARCERLQESMSGVSGPQ